MQAGGRSAQRRPAIRSGQWDGRTAASKSELELELESELTKWETRDREIERQRERERATGNSRRPRQQTWTSEYNKVVSSSIRLPRNLPASRPAPLPPPTLPLPLPADKWADEREEWGRQPVASCAHGAGALRPERQRGLRRRLAIAH